VLASLAVAASRFIITEEYAAAGTRTLDIDDLDKMKDKEIEKFEEGER